jgi:hypothetical protein
MKGFTPIMSSCACPAFGHRKQRHTAKRVFERLRDEHGFTGGYTIVKDYMRQRERRGREMFVSLAHPPGHAQAAFGEAVVIIDGVEQKAHFFVMDLPHSDACYVRAYPAATAEACRTDALGGNVAACAKCGHQHVAYNSCKNRHCPKCQGPAARDWMAARAEDLLPVEYFHVVFTVPAEIARNGQTRLHAFPIDSAKPAAASSLSGFSNASRNRGDSKCLDAARIEKP